MTPKQVRALRIKAGLTQRECAELFGMKGGARSWQKRETSYADPNQNRPIKPAEMMVLERLAKKEI